MFQNEFAGNYCPKIQSRWNSYGNYKLIVWLWMLNETTLMFCPAEISHSGFYIHAVLHAISVIFIGMPLVYSEICIGQYMNGNVISMWNFFPIFRIAGYGMIYLVILKTIYFMVLTTWYLEYAFYAVADPPPWFSCDDYNTTKCMVKRKDVSVFQHCLETQSLFDEDCGFKTASYLFFSKEIGDKNTKMSFGCMYEWKSITFSLTLGVIFFILTLKREKLFQFYCKTTITYVCSIVVILFCVSVSTSGTWYTSKFNLNYRCFYYHSCMNSIIRGFLSVGTGYGMMVFLSKDVSFRSPATITAVVASLFSVFICSMFSLIVFGGVKTMIYYHSEEERVLEEGDSIFFAPLASISEIMSYFDAIPIWGFFWFSSIFVCLFFNLWLLFLYIKEFIYQFTWSQKYCRLFTFLFMLLICVLTWPFYCVDLTTVLLDTTEVIQISNSLLFSLPIYWIYGFKSHAVDIIFMIGIKSNWFWKFTQLINPVILIFILLSKCTHLEVKEHVMSLNSKVLQTSVNHFLFYVVMGIYIFILVVGISTQLMVYYRKKMIWKLFSPTDSWGPRDKILFKSRKMFVPEIMTREFLYRQVRLRGYYRSKKISHIKNQEYNEQESIFS